jgi:hypothetical protein
MAREATLTYIRAARRQHDGYDGVLYVHAWATGAQELVFADHEAAERWAQAERDAGRATTLAGYREAS